MKTKSLVLILTLFSTTSLFSQIPSYVPTNGLVGYWPFNGNANDVSGNGNNGTVNGATLSTDRNGNANEAYSFDGTNDFIDIQDSPSIRLENTSYTVSFWINFNSFTNSEIIRKDNVIANPPGSSQNEGYAFTTGSISNSLFAWHYPNPTGDLTGLSLNSWFHIAYVYEIGAQNLKLFVNSSLTNSKGLPPIASSTANIPLRFGAGPVNGPYWLNGKLDDVCFWNRALTQQEITALYQSNNCSVPAYVPTNGLVGYWPFCGNANDVSGNGNDGTVNGATLTIDRNGNTNEAYSFDGVNDNIQISDNSTFGFLLNASYSVSFWTKLNSLSGTQSFIGQGDGDGLFQNRFWRSYFAQNQINNHIRGNLSDPFDTRIAFNNTTVNSWIMISMVRNYNSSLSMYINGVLVDSDNDITGLAAPFSQVRNIVIGGFFDATSNQLMQFLNGSMDDIGIWNRALSQQEISTLYANQSCNSHAITADGPTTFCAGNSVNLTSNIAGATYQWKKNGVNIATNATSRSYKVTAAGSYTCVATCNGNLVTSNAIQVTTKGNTNPVVSALGATTFCVGDSVTLSCNNLGSNYSIQWYRTGVSMENATAYTKVVTQPGTYKVVSKNNTNGCSRIGSSSVVVAVNCRMSDPNTPSVQAPINDESIKSTEAASSSILYIYPNPAENRFTVEFMGVEQHGTATLEIINGLGQVVAYKDVYVSDGYLREEFEISNESKGGICLVRLVIGDEVYDSKVVLR